MYQNNLMNRFSLNSTIVDSLMKGANCIFQNYKISNDTMDYNSGDQILNPSMLGQNRVYGPLAINIKPVSYKYINPLTLVYELPDTFVHLSSRISGDFIKTTLPIYNINTNTLIGDIIGSMFINAMQGDMSTAYAMLRSAQLFISMNESVMPIRYSQANSNNRTTQIKLNRI